MKLDLDNNPLKAYDHITKAWCTVVGIEFRWWDNLPDVNYIIILTRNGQEQRDIVNVDLYYGGSNENIT